MQQLFLRWNQGQDLRQALITIAISIILADQMLAHFGGVAEDIAWPRNFDTFVNLRVQGIQYTLTRLVILGIARRDRAPALALAQEHAHRHGHPRGRRRPRDGLGARDQHPADVRASRSPSAPALAGLGGVIGGSFASLAPGVDANWLLYSLVVVIIGGMGSLGGAADRLAAARPHEQLRGRVSAGELHVLLDHLHVRARRARARGSAARALREARVTPRQRRPGRRPRRARACVDSRRSTSRRYWVGTLLTQMLFLGIVAASLIFLSAYGGMVSLAQVAIFGIAGFVRRQRHDERKHEGPQPGLEPLVGRPRSGIAAASLVGLLFGALASRSVGIYFLMITLTYSVIANLIIRPGDGRLGIRRDQRHPGSEGDRHRRSAPESPVLRGALRRPWPSTPCFAMSPGRRSAWRCRACGTTRSAWRRWVTTSCSIGRSRSCSRRFIAAIAGVLFVWWNGHIDPASIDLGATIDVLVIAVIGGLYRIEGAWVGALFFVIINNYSQQISFIGPRFHTLIGAIFLVIVLVSPGGLIGLWDSVPRCDFCSGRGGPSDRTPLDIVHPEPST